MDGTEIMGCKGLTDIIHYICEIIKQMVIKNYHIAMWEEKTYLGVVREEGLIKSLSTKL